MVPPQKNVVLSLPTPLPSDKSSEEESDKKSPAVEKAVFAELEKKPAGEAATLEGMVVSTKPAAQRPSTQKHPMDSKEGDGSSKKSCIDNELVHLAMPPIPFADDDSFADKSVESLPDQSTLPKYMPTMRQDVAPKNPGPCTMVKGKKIIGNPKLSAGYSLAAAVSHKIRDCPFQLAPLEVECWCKHLAGMEMKNDNLLGKMKNMLNLVLSPLHKLEKLEPEMNLKFNVLEHCSVFPVMVALDPQQAHGFTVFQNWVFCSICEEASLLNQDTLSECKCCVVYKKPCHCVMRLDSHKIKALEALEKTRQDHCAGGCKLH